MWSDLRFALRILRRQPATTLTIVAAVALGVAAVSTVFSWSEGLVLRPLPALRDPGHLVSLKAQGTGGQDNLAWEEFQDWRGQAASYEGAAAFGIRRLGLREPGAPSPASEPVWGMLVSGDYFGVLGVEPQLGRVIDSGDVAAEGSAFVAVISDALWKRRFGGSPDILGRRIVLNGRDVTVVGVAPPRFAGTYVGLSFDVWVPLTIQEQLGGSPAALRSRDFRWLQAFARLLPDVPRERALAEAVGIGRRLAASYPASRDVTLAVQRLDMGAASRLAPLFGILLGLAVVVLLIVCATVSNLMLAQATRREAEMAVRLAIGARPGRLVRQLFVESALLALLAGALGALVSTEARGLFPALLPPSPLPLAIDTPLDGRVLAAAVAVTALTLLLFGLVPALGTVRRAAALGLRRALAGDRSRARWRRGLVASQIAFSLAALASGAMFARRLAELREVDRGFDAPEHVLLVTTDLDVAEITDRAERRSAVSAVLEETRDLPDVVGVSVASFVPLGFTGYREAGVEVPGYVPVPGEAPMSLLNEIGPDYFQVMRIPLVAGRPILESDRADAPLVAVVNEAFARRYGLDEPVGRRVALGGREVTVVGVARDGKYRFDELEEPARPLAWVPWEQWDASEITVHVRTGGDPLAVLPSVRQAFSRAEARLPVLTPTTLEVYTSLPLFPGRLATTVMGILALGALALSALGLYGVTRFAVATRTREIGIRMALGAAPGRLLGLLIGDSARFASLGLAIGVVLGMGVGRVLVAILPRLRPDPVAVLVAAGLLALVFGTAVTLAARTVLRTDPVTALRDA